MTYQDSANIQTMGGLRRNDLRVADPHDGDVFMTTKEAARFLRVSHRTLEDWRLSGQGPRFRKWGRLVRYHVADLRRFAKGSSFSSTGEAQAA